MSQITAVYAAIAGMTVTTTGGKTPTVYNLSSLMNSVETAHLPCRLMLPIGNNPGDGREGQYIAIGTTMTVDWQINDLMLWQTSQQGLGLQEFAPQLIDYCGKYMDAIRSVGKAPASNCTLTSISLTPGEYNWPAGSDKWFSGVLCQLTIHEVLNG